VNGLRDRAAGVGRKYAPTALDRRFWACATTMGSPFTSETWSLSM
jgi:hypothetical protein